MITVTDHQIGEWSRMATDAYRTGRNFYGHRYSAAVANFSGVALCEELYDSLMFPYRRWLVGGWAAVETPE